MFNERYTSRITLSPGHSVRSEVSESALFHHLDSTWEFHPGPTPGSCWIEFRLEFAFRSPLYRQAASLFFEEVVQHMMGAFQTRCGEVFGPSSLAGRKPRAPLGCAAAPRQPQPQRRRQVQPSRRWLST